MTTLQGRDQTALLVIDVQNGVVDGAYRRDEVIQNIEAAVAMARAKHIPVIWVQHSDEELVIDSDVWQIVSELIPLEGEPMVRKIYRSSFEATNLEEILDDLSVGHIIVCGAQSNNCVRHTIHTALEIGFDVTLIGDAHTTTGYTWNGHTIDAQNVIDEQNDNLGHYDLPGRFARVVTTSELSFN